MCIRDSSSSSLGKVKCLDSATNASEDNKCGIRSNNTTSPEHTSGNCCDEVIVYTVIDITCENHERIVEFEPIIDSDSIGITHKNPEPIVEPGTGIDTNLSLIHISLYEHFSNNIQLCVQKRIYEIGMNVVIRVTINKII